MTRAIPLELPAATQRAAEPSLQLLDSFELTCGGGRLELPLAAQRLLAFLALHDQPLLRGYVAGTLWLDSNEAHAAGSLRSALWRIRRLGLRLVKGIGESVAKRIEAVRREWRFASVDDVVRRCELRKDDVEALAEAGAFESLTPSRRALPGPPRPRQLPAQGRRSHRRRP